MLNDWSALIRFLDEGRICLSNRRRRTSPERHRLEVVPCSSISLTWGRAVEPKGLESARAK